MYLRSFLPITLCIAYSLASPLDVANDRSTSSLTRSVNAFGFDLVRKLGGRGNLFVSPLSIYAALAMTHLGAGGRTADQLETAFRLRDHGLSGQDIHRSFRQLLDLYQQENDQYSLEVANGLFLQKDYDVRQQYASDLERFYRAVLAKKDFINNGVEATSDINRWVAEKTRNKIEKLLEQPLDPLTRLVLLNAVYFKGTWKTQFDKNFTKQGTFYKGDNEEKTVKYMNLRKVEFPYYIDYDAGYEYLELPYKGKDISMIVALPERTNQIYRESPITASSLDSIRRRLRLRTLEKVTIPKFRLEYGQELKESLAALGIQDLFGGKADLTGISEKNDLLVSSVLHKAVIDVNEEGSEAAAVTGVIIQVKSSLFRNPKFVVDHPFYFYIVDNRNGLILFTGRVVDP